MNCPRCGSDNIRRSRSQDSVWFRFVLQKKMRCQRCCFAFVTPLWERPVSDSMSLARSSDRREIDDVEVLPASA
jgi:hypothetical protein